MKKKLLIFSFLWTNFLLAQGPFAPAWGIEGNSAIHKDSSIIIDWASQCAIKRGYMDILNPSLGYTTVGDSTYGIGKAQTNGVVSLGDGGEAILQFNGKIYDGPGPDFAVFENAFSDMFLELAFVEVSSDGNNYFRFPAHSHSDTLIQIGSFGRVEASNIHNLAGKYPMNYGTPFDLADLSNQAGLDVQNITHIKIIDVVGNVDTMINRDSEGRIINDPYPTPFPSGGFDLDAVGVIHITSTSLLEHKSVELNFYPNPVENNMHFDGKWIDAEFRFYNANGYLQLFERAINSFIDISSLPKGVYFLEVLKGSSFARTKVIKL